jgi:hypothetical protein
MGWRLEERFSQFFASLHHIAEILNSSLTIVKWETK